MLPPTLAEMTAWSVEEIQAAVRRALPDDWRFSGSRVGPFRATIRDASGSQQWSGEGLDERLLMLDAYAWLLLRDHKAPEEGPWAPRRRELTHRIVQADAEAFADPPDLDPAELDAVYSRVPGKTGQGE
jgi:hypothetical protein